MTPTPKDLGWDSHFEKAFHALKQPHLVCGRLIRETKINFTALLAGDEVTVSVSGKLWHDAEEDADLPAVGDWVAIDLGDEKDEPIIKAILERKSKFSRKMPGNIAQEQVIAANVDYVTLVTDAGSDFNLRRVERYLTLIAKCGATPVILINKSDQFPAEQNEAAAREIKALSEGVEVWITSAVRHEGLEVLRQYLKEGITMALVGSSGVGKSTLINQLLGEEWQWTAEVNEVTGKGRHTTVARELLVLEEGGLLVDNPGIREVQMWTDEATLRESFQDIEDLTQRCQFHDCRHQGDKGCAIRLAVESGELEEERYESYLRLEEEIVELKRKRKKRQMIAERWSKRTSKVTARNLNDRIQLEKDERGEI